MIGHRYSSSLFECPSAGVSSCWSQAPWACTDGSVMFVLLQCPFAHPGEKAKRRCPKRYRYSGTACPEFRRVSQTSSRGSVGSQQHMVLLLSGWRQQGLQGNDNLSEACSRSPFCRCCWCRMAAADVRTRAPLHMACLSAGCTRLATGPRYGTGVSVYPHNNPCCT